MPSTLEPSPVDVATDTLTSARAAHAELLTTRDRLLARQAQLAAEMAAAESAAVAAAASLTPDDDAGAVTALTEARTRHSATGTALAKTDAQIAEAERHVVVAEQAVRRAQAGAELDAAVATVPAFDRALRDLIAAVHAIEGRTAAAKRQVSDLHIPTVIGRRITHALQGAGVKPDAEGSRVPDAAGAVRDALQQARAVLG